MRLMADLTIDGMGKVSHRWFPANERIDAYGILRFGEPLRGIDVYLSTPADIDAVIAELAALRAEMTAAPDATAPCECSHPNSLHGPGGCLRPSCGCGKFRAKAASDPEPAAVVAGEVVADDESSPCMMVGCGHNYDDHALDLERGDRLYCQRCECRRYLSVVALRIGGNLVPLGGES